MENAIQFSEMWIKTFENYITLRCKVESRIRALQGPQAGPGRQMRHNFSNGPTRQMRGNFSYGPGRHMRGDFSNGPAKGKWVFKWPDRATEKGRIIILRVSLGWQKKEEVFKPADKNLIVDNKCKCADEMCLSVFITGL